jgi:hypothetical protein
MEIFSVGEWGPGSGWLNFLPLNAFCPLNSPHTRRRPFPPPALEAIGLGDPAARRRTHTCPRPCIKRSAARAVSHSHTRKAHAPLALARLSFLVRISFSLSLSPTPNQGLLLPRSVDNIKTAQSTHPCLAIFLLTFYRPVETPVFAHPAPRPLSRHVPPRKFARLCVVIF